MKISIVTTLYHSAPHIAEFHRRVTNTAKELGVEYEIIMVNDGSPDNSYEVAVDIARQDTHVVVVGLSRNFGHYNAIITGLSYASGDRIFLLDSDLEEEPEWLRLFTLKMDESGCDMVYGVQDKRKGGWFERISGRCYFALIRLITQINLPKNFVTARLMTRRFLDAFLSFGEREVWLGGLMFNTGFEQCAVVIHKHSLSESTYTFRRKMYLFLSHITAFSNTPLIAIFFIGGFIFLISFSCTLLLLVSWFFFAKPLVGWTSVIVSIWLLGGLMITFIGIIGVYLATIFSEVKGRPRAIVKEVYGR